MDLTRMETEAIVKRIVVKTIKFYRGKGPEYVNVAIENNTISITAKGILTNLGKVLIDNGEIEFVKTIRDKSCQYIYQILIQEIYESLGLKCSLICENSDFLKDTRLLILHID